MSDDLQNLMDGVLLLDMTIIQNGMRLLSRKHRQALGTHEWFEMGQAVGFLKSLQEYALEQKLSPAPQAVRPADSPEAHA